MLTLKNRISLLHYGFGVFLLIFFGIFLIYPVLHILKQAFFPSGTFSLNLFIILFQNPNTRDAIYNSLRLGVLVTILTSLIAFPVSLIFHRYQFPGKAIFSGLLLIPLIIPPFVGAIGVKQLLSQFGSLNLLLMDLHIIEQPIDWLASSGFWGVVFLETLHLYPIMFLNLSASIANLDPVYDEAAQSLGASFFHRLRTVTLPLVLPGYFAGAILVFLWAMTDLGTPLIFDYSRVIPMMIFNMITDMYSNPMGYSLVVFILMLTISSFWISKRWAGGKNYEMYTRGYMQPRETNLWKSKKYLPLLLIYGYLLVLLFISSLPHIGVLLNSLADEWFMTILPEKWTFKHYTEVFTHPLALSSIKMSLLLSISSTVLDVLLGLGIAYLVTRKKIKGAAFLDSLTMLTLTIPGIILAFGYISCFSGTFLDPRIFPVPLLILAYSIRRLPYMVRSAYAGFLQSSMTLEEASASLGASSSYTFFKITLPLVFSHVLVGGLMCFAFAMLEVSDSLILAMQEKYYPITKTIWYLSGRSGDGLYLASAMGVLGMILLCITFLVSSKFLGKKLGDLFKVS